jgi:glyoxylase-like metal-dependent hydrolase (beta-lactamase superfamily II)
VADWAFPTGIELSAVEGDQQVASGVRVVATPGHQSVVVETSGGTRTVVCCQATWNVRSFDAGTLGDDGWDEAAGAASLEKLHALQPDRVLLSHDPDEWRRRE